jgi:hypothetical protein
MEFLKVVVMNLFNFIFFTFFIFLFYIIMYKTFLIVLIIIILLFAFSKIELFTTNEIITPNIDTIVINDVVMNKSNFINDKIIDNNNLLITNLNKQIRQEEYIKQEEINLSNIMIPYDKFDSYFNEYNTKLINEHKQEIKNDELDTNISNGLLNTDITNIYIKYIKRIPSYLNDPDMRSYNIDDSTNYSGLMDIGFIKLI